ncbi:MAG TPA: dihydrolipoyl dehydrogenase [Verrucomicrobiota bacterium]|nr:dihydrolipoyl dehydrogenase [Verrucomicrobiota bacterium]HPU55192.1 dihydrolipoyl dehydrogenase [Verrucomicrobiota bacterium]
MNNAYEFDVVVIGAGSAGYAAARTAAAEGLRTAVIEGGDEVGGLCILRGCMPTKALLYAAEVFHLAGHAEPWGVRSEPEFDFSRVMARKNALIHEFAEYRREQLASGAFEFIRARASFLDPHTIELSDGRKVSARHFVVATGSTVAPSPLPDLDETGYLTSDTALALERLPRSLIVLGGGAVAVEFAQFFVRFGVKVTLVQRSPRVLHEMDSDAAEVIENVLRREGATVYTGTRLVSARVLGSSKEVAFEHNGRTVRVQAEEIFFALGRVPNVRGLGLDRAGVVLEHNRIRTNAFMQTSAPHIFAAGDCASLHEIVHIAVQQGETAAFNIAHPDRMREMDYRLLAEVVFTEPQIASVGLTEKRAHVRNVPYLVATYPFNDHGKSLIMEARDGFVKLLADPVSGEIIGGACVGPMGGELIHEILAAMAKRMTVAELAAMPHYHPTLAEIWTYPAEELAARVSAAKGG